MKWISVKDESPPYKINEELNWVILKYIDPDDPHNLIKSPNMFIGRRGNYGDENAYESALGDGWVASHLIITHWMPLPEPPQENPFPRPLLESLDNDHIKLD